MQKHIILGLLLTIKLVSCFAQSDLHAPPFIRVCLNRIKNPKALDSFFLKLNGLEKERRDQINIVHIGDSHLQAGFISKEIRQGLQQRFGNAGRGLIFPYAMAKSNGPDDIASASTIQWNYNRLAHPEIPLATGISGFCISTENAQGTLSVSVKNTTFSNLQLFFIRDNSTKNALYSTNNGNGGIVDIASDTFTTAPIKIKLYQPANKFTFIFPPEVNRNTSTYFHGLSVTLDSPGIIYHNIGVNGARFNSYVQSKYFFDELSYLSGDLYIVSLGTNEAQNPSLSPEEFERDLTAFYDQIKKIDPNAIVLLTTPASSFYKNTSVNTKIEMIRNCIISFAEKHTLPYWDLFEISCGNSARYWRTADLMAADGVHYNNKGYALQGQLFLQALLKSYYDFRGAISATNK